MKEDNVFAQSDNISSEGCKSPVQEEKQRSNICAAAAAAAAERGAQILVLLFHMKAF